MSEHLLTVEDLAARYSVPVKTVYAWNYKRTGPPPLVVGRFRRWRLADVLAWEEQQVRGAR